MWPPLNVPPTGEIAFTDCSKWRLVVGDGGSQTWTYLKTDEESAQWPQNEIDKFWLGQPTGLPDLPKATNALEAAQNGYKFYKHLQAHDGHWPGEYGGPLFPLPGLVMGSYITGMALKEEERLEMIRYIFNHANPEDGGWGLHVEGHSTMFGTGMNYITLRLLGVDKSHPVCVKARGKLHQLGGCTSMPLWGKFWLSLLNLYDWSGINPIQPELWVLPEWLPFHPRRWCINVRNLYMPMSYLYGVRFQMEENDLILSLREELYTENYYSINWPAQRNNINPVDINAPHSALFDTLAHILSASELCTVPPLRRAAIERAYRLIAMEDENTGYYGTTAVVKMVNLIARFHREGSDSVAYKEHMRTRQEYMWVGKEGMMMSGLNGTQTWDLGLIGQALAATGLAEEEENRKSVAGLLEWLDQAQSRTEPKFYKEAYRHTSKGGWGFSTKEQGYIVTDCTAEALKAVMALQFNYESTPKLVSKERMCDAVDLLLSLQNPNGGFAGFELVRGPAWLELLNPAELFADIMIEYCYPECTTSAITALASFRKQFPEYRAQEIDRIIKKAVAYLRAAQQPDGGWVGSWGVCFTYGTQFALEGLSIAGETYATSESARRACEYLVGKQRSDGGWGESFKSCEESRWIEHENTQVVQTCWAAMALMHAKYPYPEPIEKAVKLVMSRQLPDGSWPQEAIEGVVNKSCAIAYPNYKFAFPIWMLGMAHRYLRNLKDE